MKLDEIEGIGLKHGEPITVYSGEHECSGTFYDIYFEEDEPDEWCINIEAIKPYFGKVIIQIPVPEIDRIERGA